MAYHTSSAASLPGGSYPGTTPSGIWPSSPAPSVGDYTIAIVSVDSAGVTWIGPAGWAQVGTQVLLPGDTQTIAFFQLTGGAGSSAPALAWNSGSTNDTVIIIACFSGRTLTPTFAVQTSDATGTLRPSPVAMTLTGGTAVSGDDLCILTGLDVDGPDTWTISGATGTPGTATVRQNVNAGFSNAGLSTLDNVAAGATGTLSITSTRSGGSSQQDGFASIVISIPSSGGGGGGIIVGPVNYVTA